MALVDFAPADQPSEANQVVARVFTAVVGWVAERRAARVRRLTLRSLLEMEAYRLDDLGITPQDVADALER